MFAGSASHQPSSDAIWHGVVVSYDTIRARELGVGDTLLFSHDFSWPAEAVAVVREPDTLRAYWFQYLNSPVHVPMHYADTAARFYDRNRGHWKEVTRSAVPARPALDSLQQVLSSLYGYRTPWTSMEPKVYYLRLGTRRSFVRDQSARLRSELALLRILGLTAPPPPAKHRGARRRG